MRTLRLIVVTTMLALAVLLPTAGVASGVTAGSEMFVVRLSPQAPNTTGAGVAILQVDPATGDVCYRIIVTGIGEPTEPAPGLGAAHIHDAGGIFVDLETSWTRMGQDTFSSVGCVSEDPAKVAALLADPSAYYVNIHTVAFPGGALSGPLG